MENPNNFLDALQIAYTKAFLNPNSEFITPGLIVGAAIASVLLGIVHEKVLLPAWLKRYTAKHKKYPNQSEFMWFHLGEGAALFLGTAIWMLVLHWPS